MKILLIHPPVEDFFFTPQRAYPVGILSLATVLKEAGFRVKVLNCLEDYMKTTLRLPREFSYLKRYYHSNKSPFCLFSGYYRFGIGDGRIVDTIKNFQPEVVGISSNFSAYFDSSIAVAKLVKETDGRIVVVLGGRVPTNQPELALGSPYVDFVLRGEAEYSFLKLCRAIEKGKLGECKGLCYKKSGNKMFISKKISVIKHLDRLPISDRRLINYKKYRFKGLISTSIVASRGCAMDCSFCAIQKPFRYRRAQGVLREVEDCFSLGVRHFNFEDDNMNLNPEFEKILDVICEKFGGKIKISFMSGLLSLGLNNRLREKLLRTGLTHLDLSIATSNSRLRKKMGRSENARNMFNLAFFMGRRRVPVTVHFIVGFPRQRFSGAVEDLRLLAGKPVMLGPSIFYPVVESKMFGELKDEFSVREENYRFFRSSAAFFDKFIARDRIFLVFYFSRIINFIKELADAFKIEDADMKKFLERQLSGFCVRDDVLYRKNKLDRITLGMILLDRLFRESRLYRVKEVKDGSDYRYVFEKEEFVSARDIRYILKGLVIRSVCGSTVKI